MKWTPFRVVLALNLLIIAGIYLLPYGGNSGGYIILFWAMLTLLQIAANLVLAAIGGVFRAVAGPDNPLLKGVPQALLFSAGLVLVISFPLCFSLSQFKT